jgi:hypothetical protein
MDRVKVESFVLLFAEKVMLAAVVPLCVLLVVNPMKFDGQQRISAVIILLAGGYFIAHTIEKRDKPQVHPAPIAQPTPLSDTPFGMKTEGPCSPIVAGSGNTVAADCQDSDNKAHKK